MAETVKVKHTAVLLDAVYKNVKMAADSIITMMPSVKDEKFKHELTVQLSAFEAFASRAAKQIGKEGEKPREENIVTRASAKMGNWMNTVMDSTTPHLAQMIIEGATMGVTDLMRELGEAEGKGVNEEALRLAQDVCRYEEKIVEDMKPYLK